MGLEQPNLSVLISRGQREPHKATYEDASALVFLIQYDEPVRRMSFHEFRHILDDERRKRELGRSGRMNQLIYLPAKKECLLSGCTDRPDSVLQHAKHGGVGRPRCSLMLPATPNDSTAQTANKSPVLVMLEEKIWASVQ